MYIFFGVLMPFESVLKHAPCPQWLAELPPGLSESYTCNHSPLGPSKSASPVLVASIHSSNCERSFLVAMTLWPNTNDIG